MYRTFVNGEFKDESRTLTTLLQASSYLDEVFAYSTYSRTWYTSTKGRYQTVFKVTEKEVPADVKALNLLLG